MEDLLPAFSNRVKKGTTTESLKGNNLNFLDSANATSLEVLLTLLHSVALDFPLKITRMHSSVWGGVTWKAQPPLKNAGVRRPGRQAIFVPETHS